MLTVEDILEEIIGEIRDEFDEEKPTLHKLSDGSYSVDGHIPFRGKQGLGSKFESEDFDTIGGLVFGHPGRAPEVGDELVVRERGEEDTSGEQSRR